MPKKSPSQFCLLIFINNHLYYCSTSYFFLINGKTPDFKVPDFKAPEISISAPKFDVPAAPKFDIPAVKNTDGYNLDVIKSAPTEDEFLESQEVRDNKAKEAKAVYKGLVNEAKVWLLYFFVLFCFVLLLMMNVKIRCIHMTSFPIFSHVSLLFYPFL